VQGLDAQAQRDDREKEMIRILTVVRQLPGYQPVTSAVFILGSEVPLADTKQLCQAHRDAFVKEFPEFKEADWRFYCSSAADFPKENATVPIQVNNFYEV
jgi:hypothetical protein